MQTMAICKILDRANELRASLGAGPGVPVHRIPHPIGVHRFTWWRRLQKITRLENKAAALLDDGLRRHAKKKL